MNHGEITDRIKSFQTDGIYLEECRLVGEDQISMATSEQITKFDEFEQKVHQMLASGYELMNNNMEPEFI